MITNAKCWRRGVYRRVGVVCALGAAMGLFLIVGSACNEEGEAGRFPYICANGVATSGVAVRPDTTLCSVCDSGYRLKGGACAANAYACINGTAEAGTPEEDGTPRCAACTVGYHLRDATCVANRYACASGQPKNGRPPAGDALGCVSCDSGYHIVEYGDGSTCERNAFVCPNGTPVHGQPSDHGETRCVECDSFYHLENDACVENIYTCDEGTAARTKPTDRPEEHNKQFCVSCDMKDYSVHADAVTGSQVCGGTNYICVNGVAVDSAAPRPGEQSCGSCHTGYRLENERCIANRYSCEDGRAARGIPAVNGEPRCVSCNSATYRLEGIECVEAQHEYVLGLASVGDTLYMIGGKFGRLYTVHPAVDQSPGERGLTSARAVDSTLGPGFGVGESAPSGLAAIGDTLYMVGRHHDRLYTVDVATGVATAVGKAARFGVEEADPWGLATIDGTLYMAGNSWDRLYAVDAATGVARVVGEGILPSEPRGLAAIGNTLYLVDDLLDRLLIVDTATGGTRNVPHQWAILQEWNGTVAKDLGQGFFPAGRTVGESQPTGLASIGETLYMGGYDSRVYIVDPASSIATHFWLITVAP